MRKNIQFNKQLGHSIVRHFSFCMTEFISEFAVPCKSIYRKKASRKKKEYVLLAKDENIR